jgi:RHS repeat-associated protein
VTDGEMVAPDRHVRASWCAVGGCVANGKYFVRTIQDGTPTNTTVFDPLRRPLRSRTRLLDETDSIVDTQYDARGRVSRQSAPFRDGDPVYWTQFTGYDVLGRLTGKIEPQPNQDGRGHRVTTYTYSGRQTAIKVCGSLDPASRCLNLSRTTDSLGRYMETVDAKAGVTRFWYDSAGNALAIRDANQNVIQAAYNALGQRTSVSDPNQGSWSFGYNALGEVLAQTDARNITTSTQYDKLGRPVQVSATVDIDGVGSPDAVIDTFTYDPAYGRGLEGSQTRTINGAVQRTIATTYDLLSRPASVTYDNATGSPGVFLSLTQETAYDVYYGRPKAQSYGNGETLWLRYSKYGQPIRESDAATGTDYRVVTAVDARGNAIAETLAGGELGVVRAYHPQTGQVASIRYGNLSNPNLRVLTYAYDVFGNLGQQTLSGATQEDFAYDALHRLTEATRTGAGTGTVQYGYDAVGNFRFKSDFSTASLLGDAYRYTGGTCGGGPNAVKVVQLKAGGTRTYCYDANGNLTSDSAGLAMKYDHTQRPVQIVRGGITRHFRYDAAGSRFWQFGGGESTQYFPGVEKRYGAINDEKTYLGSHTLITRIGSTRKVEYLLTDRLGSVEAVANADGAMIESRGYDAFGKPRLGTWANAPNDRLGSTANTPHGFTGHEHLNSLNLIHMNGRVYDYALGRFTGVDPVIQFPLNSQSLNPYSYILNNPLSGTDPTGYAACADQKAGPGDGDVCQITTTERVKETGSNIAKTVTHTYTVANNGGTYYITPGSGTKANAAISSAMIGAASTRSNNGPGVGPIPMRVGERPANMASCAKAGTNCEAEQYLYNPSEPSWAAKTFGDIAGSFRPADEHGYRNNPFTGQPTPNPIATRQEAFVGFVSLFAPMKAGWASRGEMAAGAIARVAVPESVVSGTTLFGDAMHLRMASWFEKRFGSDFTT